MTPQRLMIAGLLALTPALLVGCMSAENGARAVRAASDPLVASVEYHSDWFDGDAVHVALVESATDADARRVWCEVMLPNDLSIDNADLYNSTGTWDAPSDCADPADVPSLAPWG